MNYIKDVANMLNLELGEPFDIVLTSFNDEPLSFLLTFKKDKGLVDVEKNSHDGNSMILYDLINGGIKVVKIDENNEKHTLKSVNHVEEVANMLGVKLKEEFQIKENNRKSPYKEKYTFLNNVGLVNTKYGEPLEFLQEQLIYGKATIIREE